MSNLKIQRIPDSAFRLWVKGLCYCQMHLTDGVIPREALGPMEAKRKDVDALCTPQVEGKAALWERINAIGFRVYNYLKYNDSRAHVEEKREKARERMDKVRSREPTPHVREKLREPQHANVAFTSASGSERLKEREFEGKPTARSKRPIFTGQRLTVFEWMLDDCTKTLGNFTDSFELHEWFFQLDAEATATDLVIPQRDNGAWLQARLLEECQKRGLPIARSDVQTAGKLTTRLAHAVENITKKP